MSVELPMVFASWGFRKGAAAYGNAGGLADLCVAQGIRTVAVQLGADHEGNVNTELQDAEWIRERGVKVMVWGVADGSFAATELQRLGATEDEWLPQVEGSGQRDLVLDAAAHGLRPSAIVTNYGGAGTPDEVARLRDAGVRAVLVECYNDAGIIYPYTDLDRMLAQGEVYGWKASELAAVMGTYHGELPGDYHGTGNIGRDFGLYLAEPTTPAQWQAFGELNEGAPPTPTPEPEGDDVDPITDVQARDGIMIVAQGALSAYSDPKPKGRNTVCWRIANASDDAWNKARDAVVAALDGAGVPSPK